MTLPANFGRYVHVCVARGAIRSALEKLEREDDPTTDDIRIARGILMAAVGKIDDALKARQ